MVDHIQTGVDQYVQDQMDELAEHLENSLNCDVMAIIGPLFYGADQLVRQALEVRKEKRQKLSIILDTDGGVVEVVERMVGTLRHHYKEEVVFIIPDRAMSAGTVFAMSGDGIMMDYFSCLGPIDPQVEKDGKLVPALSYLVQFNRLIKKSEKGTLTTAELVLLQNLDLAELHSYEEARALSVALLEKWLAAYKFKNWNETETRRQKVTPEMRSDRAHQIAEALSDHEKWHSHGRPLSMEVLRSDLNLRIDDFGSNEEWSKRIRNYFGFLEDYMAKIGKRYLVHTRGYYA